MVAKPPQLNAAAALPDVAQVPGDPVLAPRLLAAPAEQAHLT
jgi:hypothetical protein